MKIDLTKSLSQSHSFSIKSLDLYKNSSILKFFRPRENKMALLSMPFTFTKKKVFTYKSIFLGFGFLFLLLGAFVYLKTLYCPFNGLLGETFQVTKNLVCSFCLIAGFASLFICHYLSVEQEVVGHFTRKAHRDLSNLYARKKIEYKINQLFNFGIAYHKSLVLNQIYRESCAKIQDLQDEAYLLFNKMILTKQLSPGKREYLYNQMILELDLKLETILLDFEAVQPSQGS